MRNNYSIKSFLLALSVIFMMISCANDEEMKPSVDKDNLLRISASFAPMTKAVELPDVNEMGNSNINGKEYGLKNIGLYIYYADEYNRGDLSTPYVRNLECTVNNGELVVVLGENSNPEDAHIFIYDQMVLVAFYPYNADMSLPENYFTTKSDEEKYPITRNDYSQQYYIPYRAQTNTDPTIAFSTQMTFYPKHTYKVEIVVVSDDMASLPEEGSVRVLPLNDPIDNLDIFTDGKRETWVDRVNEMPNTGGGSNVRQYVAYLWTTNENRNEISQGDVLLESDQLTLIASQNLTVQEQHVYRYGYNMSTGEIFIPTSSFIVHDIASLRSIDDSNGIAYQACDIDLSTAGNWSPLNIIGGRFDGGGHKISNMTINTSDPQVGLFGQIQGNATVCNIHLVDPVITVNSITTDTCYVGGITGRLNTVLSDADKAKLIGNLPEGLSEVVREALLQEMLASLLNSQSNIIACKVDNPTITVNGKDPNVGTICGEAGEKDQDGTYKSGIWDTYSLGGSITVNAANLLNNTNANIGGFCGLNNGFISRSYTTIDNINAQVQQDNGDETTTNVDKYTGFATMGDDFTVAEGGVIEGSYSMLPDPNNGVSRFVNTWPSGWVHYTGKWPIYTMGWINNNSTSFWYSLGSAPANYPSLQWERK